jgi:hypothetical protein
MRAWASVADKAPFAAPSASIQGANNQQAAGITPGYTGWAVVFVAALHPPFSCLLDCEKEMPILATGV